MVVICTVFFFIELISGYMIDSLALLADAFHMVRMPRGFAWGGTEANGCLAQRYHIALGRALGRLCREESDN